MKHTAFLALGAAAIAVLGAAFLVRTRSGGELDPAPAGPTVSAATGGQADWPVRFDVDPDVEPIYERVILVTIDTLRADHVTSYGYRRRTTPFLDSLTDESVLFDRAIASVSHTAPSHASMLTGLPPIVHGVQQNGDQLAPGVAVHVARLFRKAGFETAAFLNVSFLSGVAQAFEHVDVQTQRGEPVADATIAWLQDAERSGRFFLWVHPDFRPFDSTPESPPSRCDWCQPQQEPHRLPLQSPTG